MLGENIKALRNKKGMSQEVLAQQLHVVRQTISKWEKGLSVPDADMLAQIAELFEVSVSELLGAKIEEEKDINEVAAQLSLLNEQLAKKSRRNKKLLKGILIGVIVVMVAMTGSCVAGILGFMAIPSHGTETTVNLTCVLDGEEYLYDITYDEQYKVMECGGDGFIEDHVNIEQYKDANELIAQIQNYFNDRGGRVEIDSESDYKAE